MAKVVAMARRTARKAADAEAEQDSEPAGKWQGHDKVFFHKDQIAVGTKLVNFGRLYHGEIWEVIEIRSYRKAPRSGRMLTLQIDATSKLSDDVLIRSAERNTTRQVTFGTLSYSAIWRLP